MGQLIIFEQDGALELDGFPLQIGDWVQIFILDAWVSGSVIRDRLGGWHILTGEQTSLCLQTGFVAHLLSLSPETEAHTAIQAGMLGNASPSLSRSSSKGDLAESRGRIPVPRKCSLVAVSDTTREG